MSKYIPPPIAYGSGVTGNLSPLALGYNCWTVDPAVPQANRPAQAGVLYLHAVTPSTAVANGSAITVEVPVSTAGAGLTYARVALYSYAAGVATLIGQSADQAANFQAPITRQVPVVLSAAINPGDLLYLALLAVGTTGPNLIATFLGNTTARAPFRAVIWPAQAVLPTTITMSSTSASSTLFFLAF